MLHAVDLVCGAGGLSKGFMDAGVDIIFEVDNDKVALKTNAVPPLFAKKAALALSKLLEDS